MSEWAKKYANVFGRLQSLAERTSWATGVSNMLEWLTWKTENILGTSKTKYWKRAVLWSQDDAVRNAPLEQKLEYVSHKLEQELERSQAYERYARPTSTIASWREVLRRVKFFSEDYLNKEFDIFWALVSNKYLDAFYGQFTRIKPGGEWSTHGNSGLFQASTDIMESGLSQMMQMDNLSYNEREALLIANELKVRAKKNPDQILKYALMFKVMRDKKFIVPESRFLLLFIGGKKEDPQWQDLIEDEITFCRSSPKSTARGACESDVIAIAKSAECKSTTWSELMDFNDKYSRTLDPQTQQVEQKLLWGFNETLSAKAFMHEKIKNGVSR